jgi:hypothetical protein
MFESLLKALAARAIRVIISAFVSPSAVNLLPRYEIWETFSSALLLSIMEDVFLLLFSFPMFSKSMIATNIRAKLSAFYEAPFRNRPEMFNRFRELGDWWVKTNIWIKNTFKRSW